MTFLPIVVLNILIASLVAHVAFRFLNTEHRRRVPVPVRAKTVRRDR